MRILQYFLIIIFPIIIVLGNFIYLTFNYGSYLNIFNESGVYQNFSDEKTAEEATKNLLGFLRGQNMLDHNFYSDQAIFHLQDVKNLINVAFGLLLSSSAVSVFFASVLILKKRQRNLLSSLVISSVAVIAFMLLLSLGLFNSFDLFFLKFHEVLFTNDLWLFPESDNLIKLFPQKFFVLFASRLSVNILITSAFVGTFSFISLKSSSIIKKRK